MSEDDDECPISFEKYGYGDREDGYFLIKDGKINNEDTDICNHFICVNCCAEMWNQEEIRCPICREDWTEWMHYCRDYCRNYCENNSDDDEDDDEDVDDEQLINDTN